MSMITNGGFETSDLTDWGHFDDAGGYALVGTDSQSGTYAVECVNGTGNNSQLKQAPLSLTSDTLYLLEFYIKASNSGSVGVRVINDQSPFQSIGLFEDVATSTSYELKSLQFTATETISTARLMFWFADGLNNEVFKIDDVSLTAFIPPTPRPLGIGVVTGLKHGVA